MSDRIVVMRRGSIVQSGPPYEIYHHPRTAFVADFIGSANLVRGRLRADLCSDRRVALETDAGDIVHGDVHGRSPASHPPISLPPPPPPPPPHPPHPTPTLLPP